MSTEHQILPRILRYRTAPGYLGMCRAEFDRTVRPFVREFPIGARGVGFDRYELDEWADSYIALHSSEKDSAAGRVPHHAAGLDKPKSTEQSQAEFEKALELVRRKR